MLRPSKCVKGSEVVCSAQVNNTSKQVATCSDEKCGLNSVWAVSVFTSAICAHEIPPRCTGVEDNYSANIANHLADLKNGNRNTSRIFTAYSRIQARDPEKIRSEREFLVLSFSLLSPRGLAGIYLILRSSEWRTSRSTQRTWPSSSLPGQFLSLTKCLAVLYFTVSSASGKKLTDENFSLFFIFFR